MMAPYYGIVKIGEIKNIHASETDGGALATMDQSNVKFIHYADCQQLVIWLPEPGRNYRNIRLVDTATQNVNEEFRVDDKLNGALQVLWDTLYIAPGAYTIQIVHSKGGQHHIDFSKFNEEEKHGESKPVQEKTRDEQAAPIVYRDGFGNQVKNEDLQLREKLVKDMAAKFGRTISYEGNFRAGTIIYQEGDIRIEFWHEMGGGNCMFYINIPEERYWEAQTKTPLTRRDEILQFVAATVQHQQAPNCIYRINSNEIGFYYS